MATPLQRHLARKPRKRTSKRAQRPQVLAPAHRPWRAAILAVDPGNTSGWAIWLAGKLAESGTVDVFDHAEIARIVSALERLADVADLAPVLLLERPFSRRSLGASRPLWQSAWSKAGLPASRVVRAWPARWRAQLFGHGLHAAPQAVARRAEQLTARSIVGSNDEIQHDRAAAICQGAWASRAAEVGRVLPVRYRVAA